MAEEAAARQARRGLEDRRARATGDGPKVSAKQIEAAIETTLERLQTDHLDLYQIHWPERYAPIFADWQFDPAQDRADATPILEQLEAFGRIVKAGKVRYIGLSNETPYGMMEFVRLAEANGLPRILSVQNAYNLLNRTYERSHTEVTHHLDVPLLAYSPLAFGQLTGKHREGYAANSRLALFDGTTFGARYRKPGIAAAMQPYLDLASKLGMSPATLALAFVNDRWYVGANIIGATTMEQLAEDIASADVKLSGDALAEIDRIHSACLEPAQ